MDFKGQAECYHLQTISSLDETEKNPSSLQQAKPLGLCLAAIPVGLDIEKSLEDCYEKVVPLQMCEEARGKTLSVEEGDVLGAQVAQCEFLASRERAEATIWKEYCKYGECYVCRSSVQQAVRK